MASVTLKGNQINTSGELPKQGSTAADFTLVRNDLSEVHLKDYLGKKKVLNIFPSIDTPVCAMSVRTFNKAAAELDNIAILNVSMDLPFAQARYCGDKGIDKVETLSAFRSNFGKSYHVDFIDGPLKGLLSRCIIILDENNKVIYSQQVEETTHEPDYDAALGALK